MRYYKLITASAICLILAGCSFHKEPNLDINHSALQLRQFQKKSFVTGDNTEVMKSVIGALQDLGFSIKNSDANLGIIMAEMQLSDSSSFSQYMQSWIFEETTIASVKQWDATINVDKIGNEVVVRANFVAKALNKVGGIINAEPILNPTFYQDFFARVDKAFFLKKNNL